METSVLPAAYGQHSAIHIQSELAQFIPCHTRSRWNHEVSGADSHDSGYWSPGHLSTTGELFEYQHYGRFLRAREDSPRRDW